MFRQVVILFAVGMLSTCRFDNTGSEGPSTFHITVNGKDSAPGSEVEPWKSLERANSFVKPGDVVMIRAGEYSGGICPGKSGREGAPITYKAAPGERVIVNADVGIELGPNQSHIIIDGFEIHAGVQLVRITGSSHITIRNCKFFGGRGNYAAISLDNASYCVVANNYVDRQDPDGQSRAGDYPGGGDGLRLVGGSHHNLIEGNTVTRCEHVGFASSFSKADVYQSYNVWRDNVAYNNHTNFSLQDGVQRCVFENNTGYYPGLVWTGGNGNCFQFTGTNCIIRFNTLYDDTGTVHTGRRWPALVGTGAGSANGGSPSMQYNRIYNNTVYGETDQQGWKKAGWRIDNNSSDAMYQNNNVFKNNIFAGASDVQVDDIDAVRGLATMNNRYEGNLLFGPDGSPANVRYIHRAGNHKWTLNEVKRAKPAEWPSTNKEGDPLFVNTTGQGAAKDFRLRKGSPAVDAGMHLATATTKGKSSTLLVVDDAGYFTDGWGVPGVKGDSVKIEGETPAGIREIDYGTNTLTLEAPRSWAVGARVFYYRSDRFRGRGPDIGAHESSWSSRAD